MILLLVFKSKNGSAPVYISELLPSYDPGRSLRSRDKCLPTYRLEAFGGRSFLVQAARPWNELSDELRKAKTVLHLQAWAENPPVQTLFLNHRIRAIIIGFCGVEMLISFIH
jgi:hypothetical protein